MAPLSWHVLPLLAISASCLRLDAGEEANASEVVRGKRPRTGEEVARTPNGRSYLYIAGVPGTGLDYWQGALRRCTNAKICEPRSFRFYTGMFLGKESDVNNTWVEKDKQHSDRVVPMNLVSPDLDRQPDTAFYRAFANRLQGFEDPRLPLYHRLARGNGDSLKVILLTRDSAQELLAYNMKKFKLNETEADERLAADIRTLASQMSELPVDSYRCMSFEETLNLGTNMRPLFGLGDVATQALALKLSLNTARGAKGCGFSGEGLGAMYDCPHRSVKASKVRAALNALEDLCDPEDLTAAKIVKSKRGASKGSGGKIQWLLE